MTAKVAKSAPPLRPPLKASNPANLKCSCSSFSRISSQETLNLQLTGRSGFSAARATIKIEGLRRIVSFPKWCACWRILGEEPKPNCRCLYKLLKLLALLGKRVNFDFSKAYTNVWGI
jgi:hypothetical protein